MNTEKQMTEKGGLDHVSSFERATSQDQTTTDATTSGEKKSKPEGRKDSLTGAEDAQKMTATRSNSLKRQENGLSNAGFMDDGVFDDASSNARSYSNNLIIDLDVAQLIKEISNPKDLYRAIENYELRNKIFDKKVLLENQNTKIQRFKDCVYFGHIHNGNRHGKGIMVYINGRIYEGDWENNVKHGEGMEISPNGNTYEGHFLNGKPDGVGIFKWKHGESYEGEWHCGLKHGSGIWKGTGGDSYVGEWKNGKPDGHGVHIWRNGDRYEGEYMSSLKHGHGTEKFANGDLFMGNYENGKPNGFGEYHWHNGSSYKGFFKNGLRHGKGVWRKNFGKSDVYDGEWANDKKSGSGVYTWASGNYYKGSYFDDLRHGYGEMYWTDGSIYKGQWRRGFQHGEGELYIPGKSIQKGMFNQNIYCGSGDEADENNSSQSHLAERIDDGLSFTTEKLAKPTENRRDPFPQKPPTERKLSSTIRSGSRTKDRTDSRGLMFDSGIGGGRRNTVREVGNENSSESETSYKHFPDINRISNIARPSKSQSPRVRDFSNQLASRTLEIDSRSNLKPKKLDLNGGGFLPNKTFQTQQLFYVKPNSNTHKTASVSPTRATATKMEEVRPLDAKEMLRWNLKKQKLHSFDQRKYEDLKDPKTIRKIRDIIHPRVWLLWPANQVVPSRGDFWGQGTANNFYKGSTKQAV